METTNVANIWAQEFGLALTPLFGVIDREEGEHFVLLDGGHGSFALSISDEKIWNDRNSMDWSWSSDLSHHVTVTQSEVGVVRWDKPNAEIFTRSSVEERKQEFYSFLNKDKIDSNRRIISHVLDAYRRMRSLIANVGLPDDVSTTAFLEMLTDAIKHSSSATK